MHSIELIRLWRRGYVIQTRQGHLVQYSPQHAHDRLPWTRFTGVQWVRYAAADLIACAPRRGQEHVEPGVTAIHGPTGP